MRTIVSEIDLYTEILMDMYSAEVFQISALREFKRSATSEALIDLLHIHASETRMQVLRLEEILNDLHETNAEEHCRTMASMIDESKKLVSRCADRRLKDRAITYSIQRIKQCEITVYKMLLHMAESLTLSKEKNILETNLKEDLQFLESVDSLTARTAVTQ